jgi:hypothetical protein
MTDERFQELKKDFETDVQALVDSLLGFAKKWGALAEEAEELTKEQGDELDEIAVKFDEALEAME